MAFPTAVNSQVTDSVSQTNAKVLGDSPALATSKLMLAVSQALSNAAYNAINVQQNNNVTAQAALTQGVNTLMNVDTAASMVVIKIYR
ncbi:RebB family R body protein [Pseudoalteromonas sp. NC201]|uniref:RebB family R body protein n=1 Tax=Pseudoalteromonas sp. NC201 TaxID=1514074 RepID=UPI000C7E06D9|nr:RebB family R body protein [Pseudoalteromonas sp. NC201]AUJ69814.1 Killing trait [Pseudoalteromonas sp. NC201]